jgi:signal transduction histidine kinase
MTLLPQFLPTVRAERIIAGARLVLAGCSFLALSFEPSVPTRFAVVTHALTIGYILWAIVIALLVVSTPMFRLRRWQVSTHAIDLIIAVVFINLTAGTESPFFFYLLFSLMAATVRWDAHGALGTGGIALGGYLGTVVADILRGYSVEVNAVIIRSTSLIVLALMLTYIGYYAAHVRGVTENLRTWQPAVNGGVASVMADGVRYVGGVLGARCVVFVWEEEEEPDLQMAYLSDDEVDTSQEDGRTLRPLVAPALEATDFFCHDAAAAHPLVVYTAGDGLDSTSVPPIHPRLAERFAVRSVLAVRCGAGRLFIIDKPRVTVDDLWLAQIVAGQISSSLDQASLAQRLEHSRLSEARARVARDLHDGLLQSLTAVMLRLTTIGHTLDAAARRRIEAVQTIISDEARRLREFIQHLTSAVSETPTVVLPDRLEALRHHIEEDWDLRVELSTQDLQRIPDRMAHDVYFILREALINVARHAGASRARSTVAVDGDRLHIMVSDDGRGFPFQGSRDGASLAAANLGPRMLYERTRLLGGQLVVDSGPKGARLDIQVPLATRGEA